MQKLCQTGCGGFFFGISFLLIVRRPPVFGVVGKFVVKFKIAISHLVILLSG